MKYNRTLRKEASRYFLFSELVVYLQKKKNKERLPRKPLLNWY